MIVSNTGLILLDYDTSREGQPTYWHLVGWGQSFTLVYTMADGMGRLGGDLTVGEGNTREMLWECYLGGSVQVEMDSVEVKTQ